MRRRGRNARRTATASDQGARRRAAEREHVESPATQDDIAGPWSHGRGVAIKQQRQQLERSPPPLHHQYYPSGQFHLMSSSPIALTPSLSPLYKVPAANYYTSAASVAQAGTTTVAAALSRQSLDETIGRIFMTYLPNFFDALGKFQYHQVRTWRLLARPQQHFDSAAANEPTILTIMTLCRRLRALSAKARASGGAGTRSRSCASSLRRARARTTS